MAAEMVIMKKKFVSTRDGDITTLNFKGGEVCAQFDETGTFDVLLIEVEQTNQPPYWLAYRASDVQWALNIHAQRTGAEDELRDRAEKAEQECLDVQQELKITQDRVHALERENVKLEEEKRALETQSHWEIERLQDLLQAIKQENTALRAEAKRSLKNRLKRFLKKEG